ncbi:MAG: leucyl/phenylalanyl-tRNA--protein transferase [Ignavibacteriales bacterium]|nr:leucyl/phenylalanyl-tRNA--protein transferase [Ignavibacteriales bacterium]
MSKNHKSMEDEFLQPDKMIELYSRGAFPMADDDGTINWYLPEVRTIIPLDKFNLPRSLRKIIQQSEYEIKIDSAYLDVIRNCANREITWISEKLIAAYIRLYELKHLHSVEVWMDNKLVGGLYGITYKGAFFGESMFSKVSQTSKIALAKLVEHLIEKEFVLLDVQYLSPHLKMFGAEEISLLEFYEYLLAASKVECEF